MENGFIGFSLFYLAYDFTGFGKSSGFGFGKHQAVVYFDIKDTVASGNQVGLNTEFFFQFIRHTGGIGLVLSHRTIMDVDFHRSPPLKIRGS